MSADPYAGPVTLNTTYSEPELRGQDGELIATFMPHRLGEARRLAACWNLCLEVPAETLNSGKSLTRVAFEIVRETSDAERDRLRATVDRLIGELTVMRAALMASGVPARALRPPPPERCDGQQPRCKWVPDGTGSKCLTCGESMPF